MVRNLEEFNNKYKGQSCFIIGAGCSVAFEDLSLLKDSLVIAVNSGYCAVPEADFFLSDDWSVKHWSYFFDDLKNSTKTIALLHERMLEKTSSWFGNRSVLFRHKQGYELTEVYSHSEPKNHIWEARTSVGSAIHVAYIMGCRTVYLLGVDCCRHNGKRYFWEFPGYSKPYRNDKSNWDHFKKCFKDNKVSSDTDLNSICKYWNDIHIQMYNKIKVYIVSKLSELGCFPKITLEEVFNAK